ncbi:MAG: NAD(P)-dependent dehydrogenase (short-subunit alcohol dehydrogenase family) [Candidatus Poriferisodalaceae bacterium]|jgi:NAD(P)-dependent dehydrogenase (short-subunit alcohol dehydrogenase family)
MNSASNANALADKVAVITGGASGIGRACATRFAAEGATVVLGDINLEAAVAAAADIEAEGGTAHAIRLDASEPADNEAMIQAALDKYGRVDAVVAAAGLAHSGYVSGEQVARESRGLLDQSPDDWQRVMDVNLTGVMLVNQLAARAMIESGNGGTIVNIASAAAKVPLKGAVDYCVSKAGVWMLTKAFALEVADMGVRVNAIGPGFIETPMTAGMRSNDEGVKRMLAMTPMGRLGEATEIANTALFLSSSESSYITGQILFPSGGMFVG